MLAPSGLSIIIDGNEVFPRSFCMVESLFVYYHYVTFSLSNALTTRFIVINSDRKDKYTIVSASFNNGVYLYTAVPESVYKMIGSTFESFNGDANSQQFCSKVGLPYNDIPRTNSVFWMYPRSNFSRAIQFLDDFSSVQNGGGIKFFADLKGKVSAIDLKTQFSKPPKAIAVNVDADVIQTDWVLESAGEFDIVTGTLDKIEHKVERVMKDYAKISFWVNDTTGKARNMAVQAMTNQFWRNYYTSRCVSGTLTGGDCHLGDIVQINDTEKKFIVGERVLILDSTMQTNSVSVKLYASVENN